MQVVKNSKFGNTENVATGGSSSNRVTVETGTPSFHSWVGQKAHYSNNNFKLRRKGVP